MPVLLVHMDNDQPVRTPHIPITTPVGATLDARRGSLAFATRVSISATNAATGGRRRRHLQTTAPSAEVLSAAATAAVAAALDPDGIALNLAQFQVEDFVTSTVPPTFAASPHVPPPSPPVPPPAAVPQLIPTGDGGDSNGLSGLSLALLITGIGICAFS